MSPSIQRQGQPWTAEEDRKLYDLTVSGKDLVEICEAHQRTNGGIKARQVRLGLREKRTSKIVVPPPPFKPFVRARSEPRVGEKETKIETATHKPKPILKAPKKNASPTTSLQNEVSSEALKKFVSRHPDLIDRLWAAMENDIRHLFPKQERDIRDRNIHVVLSRLSPEDAQFETATLQELGDIYNISRERVRQIAANGSRLLTARIRGRRGWSYAVLKDHRNTFDEQNNTQFYSKLMGELNNRATTISFAQFVLAAMGRIDGLASDEVSKLLNAYAVFAAASKKQAKIDAAKARKQRIQRQMADDYVGNVLRKASFSGAFAAEGVRLLSLPRLRSCAGDRQLFSETLGRFVQWESQGEKRFISALDQSSIISEFAEQPIEIEFVHSGKKRKYFVDLLIKTTDDLTIAVEIKSPVMLADSFVQAKARAAEEALGELGIGYCLVDANGRSPQDLLKTKPTEELKQFLRERLRKKKQVNMRDLYAHLNEWPSQDISDQIQSLVLEHDLDYRVRLLTNKDTGKLGRAYTFSLSVSTKKPKVTLVD